MTVRKRPVSRRAFGVILMIALAALSLPLFLNSLGSPPPISHGVADFAERMESDRPVELAGRWRFSWAARPATEIAMPVPGQWTGARLRDGTVLPRRGEARYTLTLRNLAPGDYRLYVPITFGASRVAIDGRTLSQHGSLGREPRSDLRAHDVQFAATGRDLALRIDLASPFRANGFETAPVLGTVETMRGWSTQRWSQEYIIQIALALLALFGGVVFVFRRDDLASLYLALACLGLSPAALMIGYDNLLVIAFPGIDLRMQMFVAWVGGVLGVTALLANVQALFPAEGWTRPYRALIMLGLGSAALLTVTVLLGDIEIGNWAASLQLLVILAALGYIIAVIARAARRGYAEAWPLLIGVGIAGIGILAVAAVTTGDIAPDIARGVNYAGFGALCLLLAHLIVLAERWSHAITATERSNDDLRQLLEVSSSITSEIKLDALLRRIVAATSRFLGAARSSLFLHDERRGELWSMVAEGVEEREIRIGADEGLAGAAFAGGEPVVADDAYAHPSFKPEIDARTGFRTGSIISMPIATREGRKLGVMQALNPVGGGTFGADDVARMRAFAAQAAIAVDNATLFAEVVAARNYAESILDSMSSGVVTLDRDLLIRTLNPAAYEIFGVPPGALDGVDAHTGIGAANAWLSDALGEVVASGMPKVMLDVELAVAGDAVKSVNLSIVPLIDHEERSGAVVLVEDITEGKRLGGAMRRFMPQKIVEQVLERSDELLFGTSCHASVLFSDIRNFTSMSEKLSPREIVDMLNEVLGELFEAVAETDGILDKYIGDAVMAVYGVPFPTDHDAVNAVTGGLLMQAKLAAINRRRVERGQPVLGLGVGIATGEVVAGTIGSPKRMDYTVIGDSVNLAARLQELTKTYAAPIIICERTAAEVAGRFELQEIDTIQVRGREATERIFGVLPATAQ